MKIIGICIETRPDTLIDDDGNSWLPLFRKWGVTRVQLGIQHTNNSILKKINRGHSIEDGINAIEYLKDNCFKVDIHLMPDLPGATPKLDLEMIDNVFKHQLIQPDQIKIYPCEVTPWTIIKKWHDHGKYHPYAQTDERALLDVVKYAMETCPPWIRLPRVIRDIPTTYISGGNQYPNLRQMLNDELVKEDKMSMDIRYRECGRNTKYKVEDAIEVIRVIPNEKAFEYFISYESSDYKCIFGFLRLRISKNTSSNLEFKIFKENNVAMIREVHVYGNVTPVGHKKKDASQHKGLGGKLLEKAYSISKEHGCDSIAVISGIGVVNYYKKHGYEEKDHFMVKDIDYSEILYVSLFLLVVIPLALFCYTLYMMFTTM